MAVMGGGGRMARVTLGADGQLVLPRTLLDELGLDAGDSLIAVVVEGGLVLTPEPHDLIEATYGLASELWAAMGGSAAFVRETEESWRA
jgi:bifunctional DNA-binding transcriptional regulator/antitoxin component of YhaV-PrlF toxin-antitoxin module